MAHHPAAPSARATVSIAVTIVSGSASGPPYATGTPMRIRPASTSACDRRRRQPALLLGLIGVRRDDLADRLGRGERGRSSRPPTRLGRRSSSGPAGRRRRGAGRAPARRRCCAAPRPCRRRSSAPGENRKPSYQPGWSSGAAAGPGRGSVVSVPGRNSAPSGGVVPSPPASIAAAPTRSRASAMTCWPCSSPSSLRMLASGPGCSPFSRAVSVRMRIRSSTRVLDVDLRRRAGAAPGSVIGPAALAASIRSSAVGPLPHSTPPRRQRDALVAERHLGQAPAVVEVADEVGGRDAHVGEEHLVERVPAGHLGDRTDLDPRQRPSGRRSTRRPCASGASGSVRAMRMPKLAYCAPLVQIFCPLTTNSSPSRTARVPRLARSLPLARFGEQLAPELLAGQDRPEVAVLLLLVPAYRIVGPAHPMPIGLTGRRTPAAASSSSMSSWWIGSASRPHGRGQWGATYPASASSRPDGDGWPASHSRTARRRGSSSGRQLEVHAGDVAHGVRPEARRWAYVARN